MGRSKLLLLAAVLFPTLSLAQVAVSDPQATLLLSRSLAATSGTAQVNDLTLSGNVAWIAGSENQTGTVTLKARGAGQGRLDLALGNGARSEVRNDLSTLPQGAALGTDGLLHPMPLHNCWMAAGWFSPVGILSAATDPSIVAAYVGQETYRGVAVDHLRLYRALGQNAKAAGLIRRLSTADVYLDAHSLLLVAYAFNLHPADDANPDIAVEVSFGNYHAVRGVQLPFQIQRLLNGSANLNISVQTAVVNSGLTDADFSLQ